MTAVTHVCTEWHQNSNGWYLCSQLTEASAVIAPGLEPLALAAPFSAGFGLVLVSAAAGAAIGLIIRFVRT